MEASHLDEGGFKAATPRPRPAAAEVEPASAGPAAREGEKGVLKAAPRSSEGRPARCGDLTKTGGCAELGGDSKSATVGGGTAATSAEATRRR